MSKQYGKKKLTRNILIGVLVVLVIGIAIFLSIALQKDSAGMNCFQRKATAASADGVKISMGEYRLNFDTTMMSYQTTTFSDKQMKNLQENIARQTLLPRVYAKEAKALGLSLTKEQKEEAAKTAQTQIDAVKESIAKELSQSGNYSKSAVEKQLAAYYQQIGMNENEYYSFVKENAEGNYYWEAIDAYYQENGDGIDEATLLDYYRKSVEDSMYTENEDGTKKSSYSEGQYWYTMMLYQMGYSMPMMYVPEGFIYIDYIKLQKGTKKEIEEIINKVNAGEIDFDQLRKSDDNIDTYRDALEGPYPIGENDHAQMFSSQAAYDAAAALVIGEIGSFIEEPVTAEDGSVTVTGYLFRRAEGNMCMDGDSGVIKIDYYPGVREAMLDEYRLQQWISDIRFEDAMYAYKGARK
ncbi:MAG: SurA N-terminal domain-containing protein [Clostridia bacterium]|nr:SurA N-terminal domain-containing protein [Clostridia bacterium]